MFSPRPHLSLAERFDQILSKQQPLTIWVVPAAIGGLLIWASVFVQIHSIQIPPLTASKAICDASGKQVGLWFSLNWTIVYLVLFPAYLIFMWGLSKEVRRSINDFIERGVIRLNDGREPKAADLHALLNKELRDSNLVFIVLAVLCLVFGVFGWISSTAQPIYRFISNSAVENIQIIDWSTAIIRCERYDLGIFVLIYTFFAYIWMALALFIYLGCLSLGFIYAAFFSKLALEGDPDSDQIAKYSLYFEKTTLKRHLNRILMLFFCAACLGLMAGYFMRFQAQYLEASHRTIGEYFIDSATRWAGDSPHTPSTDAPLPYQVQGASNTTIYTGALVTIATAICLLGTCYMIFNAFTGAKNYTLTATRRLESLPGPSLSFTFDELENLEASNFFRSVVPFWPLMALSVTMIIFASLFTEHSLLTLIVGSVVLLIYALSTWAKDRWSRIGRSSADPAMERTPIADRIRLEKIVRERGIFVNFAQFLERAKRLKDCVCVIESAGSSGTGLLIGEDLLLTNYHVVMSIHKGRHSPRDTICRFDYESESSETDKDSSTIVKLADDWYVWHRPYSKSDLVADATSWNKLELDYAIVRLERKVGTELRENEVGRTASRGWITLRPPERPVQQDDPLFVIQHPLNLASHSASALPIQLAVGDVMGFVGGGLRLRHDARTLPGSSGSPCCNAELELVALHHAGDPKDLPGYQGEYNQAIPISLIAEDWASICNKLKPASEVKAGGGSSADA